MSKKDNEADIEIVYNHFSILLFSTLFIILAAILSTLIQKHAYLSYVAVGLLILSFIGYYYLVVSSITYYLQKTFHIFKISYKKHKLRYWLAFGILMVIILVVVAYIKLDTKDFWNTLITVGYLLAIAFIGWVAKKLYNSRKKRK